MSDTENTVQSLSDLKDLTANAPLPTEGTEAEAPVIRTGPAAPLRDQEIDAQGRA